MSTKNIVLQSYEQIMRALPPPTAAQIALFATYVAEAHSWYKHLPFYPKIPFFFYLAPEAGQCLTYKYDQGHVQVELREFTDKDSFPHYTGQPTKDYMRRFGFCDYNQSVSPEIQLVTFTSPGNIQTLTPQGNIQTLPHSLMEVGKIGLSAFIHFLGPNIWFNRFKYWMVNEIGRIEELKNITKNLCQELAQTPPQLSPVLQFLWTVLQYNDQFPDTPLPPPPAPEMVDWVERFFRRTSIYRLWEKDELLEESAKLGEVNQILPMILQAAENFRHPRRQWGNFLTEQGVEKSTVQDLVEKMCRERMRQLEAIKRAMHRFVEAVYHSDTVCPVTPYH